MEREILNLKEYDLIPLIDEYWKERDEYLKIDEDGNFIKNDCNKYIIDEDGKWNEFELVESKLDFFDLEDQYEYTDHIIKRIIDNKYFKFHSKYSYQEWAIIPNQEIEEVFPVEKTIIIYE